MWEKRMQALHSWAFGRNNNRRCRSNGHEFSGPGVKAKLMVKEWKEQRMNVNPPWNPYLGHFHMLQKASVVVCVFCNTWEYLHPVGVHCLMYISLNQSCSNFSSVLLGVWSVFASFSVFSSCSLAESGPDFSLPNGTGESGRKEG